MQGFAVIKSFGVIKDFGRPLPGTDDEPHDRPDRGFAPRIRFIVTPSAS